MITALRSTVFVFFALMVFVLGTMLYRKQDRASGSEVYTRATITKMTHQRKATEVTVRLERDAYDGRTMTVLLGDSNSLESGQRVCFRGRYGAWTDTIYNPRLVTTPNLSSQSCFEALHP